LESDPPGLAPDLFPSDKDLRRPKLDLSELDLRLCGLKPERVGHDADLHRSVPDLLLYDPARHLSAEVLGGPRKDRSREAKVRFGLEETRFGWAKDLFRTGDLRGGKEKVRFMSGERRFRSAKERFRLKEVEVGFEHIGRRMEKVRARWEEARFQSATDRSRSTKFQFVTDEVQSRSVAFRFGFAEDRAGPKKVLVRSKTVRSKARRVRFQSTRVRFQSTKVRFQSTRVRFAIDETRSRSRSRACLG
jgi:hypothetical protein